MTSNGDKLHDELVMLRNKVAKYESDHPWAKALQEVANEAVEELSLKTKALKVMKEAAEIVPQVNSAWLIKTIDEVLGKEEV
jgi:hypothetical protein